MMLLGLVVDFIHGVKRIFMIPFRVKTLFYYALPIIYIYLVRVKHFGDIHQGATVVQWVELQALALAILVGAWLLSYQVNKREKLVLLLCAVFPVIGLAHEALAVIK
jgi:hypothetical protein